MKRYKVCTGLVLILVSAFISCASYQSQKVQDQAQEYFDSGLKNQQKAATRELALEDFLMVRALQPDARTPETYTVKILAGQKTPSHKLPISAFIGFTYHDLIYVDNKETLEYLDKAVEYFTIAVQDDPEYAWVYNYFIAKCSAGKGDYDRALAAYREAAALDKTPENKADWEACIKALSNYIEAVSEGAYYVSAAGNDENDGLSPETPFKTLNHGVVKCSGDRLTVVVIGTLNDASEQQSINKNVVFTILTFWDSVLITGMPDAFPARRAVLSAAGAEKICVNAGMSDVTFTYIEISGSSRTGLRVNSESEITLGFGSRVSNNNDGGVEVFAVDEEYKDSKSDGTLTLDGGIIESNTTASGGAGVFVEGIFTMRSGYIRNNTTTAADSIGGGVAVAYGGTFIMEGGGIIEDNKTGFAGAGVYVEGIFTMRSGYIRNNTATAADSCGGGVSVNPGGTFTMEGGAITGNTAYVGAGVFVWEKEKAVFNHKAGSVSGNKAGTDIKDEYKQIARMK